MALRYTLQQSTIKGTEVYGKWYAHTIKQGELTMNEIERQVQEQCTATRADVRAVLTALEGIIERGLKDGKVVNLGALGKLYLSVRSRSVDAPTDFNQKQHVKGVVCKYNPAGHRQSAMGRRLCRSFTDDCKLVAVGLAKTPLA